MRKIALFLLLLPALLSAQNKPKLVVGIVVDQMRYEMLDRFKNDFGDGGFNLITKMGMRYDSCTYNYVPTYTGPGHATIYTGTNPNVHGILSNAIYLPAQMRTMNCVEDNSVQPIGTDDPNGARSPKNLKVFTFGDSLIIKDPASKVIAIAIKDRSAILNAGKKATAAYWMDKNGFFITSSYYMKELPAWVDSFNNAGYAPGYLYSQWILMKDKALYTSSLPDNSPFESTRLGDPPVLPYDLQALQKKEGYHGVAFTPFANSMLTEFAIWGVREEFLGRDKHTDLLAINYSATDYIGHEFGPNSVEIQDAYMRLDNDLAMLISTLDMEIGRKNYVLFLTSDHGAANTPTDTAFSYVSNDDLENLINTFTVAQFGKELVAHIGDSQIWLQESTIKNYKLDKERILIELQNYLRYQNQVEISEIFTRFEVENCASEACRFFANALDTALSGDLFYTRPFGQMERDEKYGTTHGSQYLYDTHVPLLFFGGNVEPGQSKKSVHPNQILSLLKPYLIGK